LCKKRSERHTTMSAYSMMPKTQKGHLTLKSIFLAVVFLATSAIASKICPILPPVKRHSSATDAVISPLNFPRGGGSKQQILHFNSLTVATSIPPGGGAKSAKSAAVTTNATPTITPRAILASFLKTVADAKSHLAAAAAARAVSIFGMYPVDTIKTRMQMKQGDSFRVSGLYKGVTGSLVGQVPYGVLTFGSYEIYKQALLKKFPSTKPAFIYALAAIMGDVTGSGWLCPSEVMKQQLQAGIYPSMGEAIKGIWKKNGFKGFYQGFTGGLARDVPFRVAQLTTFEITKSIYLRTKRNKNSSSEDVALSSLEAAVCGAAAGSFSAAITNPLDRIKTLMMTDTTNAYGGSVLACASKILKDDGVGGFFAGVVPRVGYIAPSVCIFFVTYEFVQQKMKKAE